MGYPLRFTPGTLRSQPALRLYFRDEDLKRVDPQSMGRFGGADALGAGKQDLQILAFELFAA